MNFNHLNLTDFHLLAIIYSKEYLRYCFSAKMLASKVKKSRTTVKYRLDQMYGNGFVDKITTKPVFYTSVEDEAVVAEIRSKLEELRSEFKGEKDED